MNNFLLLITENHQSNDTVINVKYRLIPLPKYNFKTSFLHLFSNFESWLFAISRVNSQKYFGGAENLTTSVSGTFGTVYTQKILMHFLMLQSFPCNLDLIFLDFYFLLIQKILFPNKYSPVSTISLGFLLKITLGWTEEFSMLDLKLFCKHR